MLAGAKEPLAPCFTNHSDVGSTTTLSHCLHRSAVAKPSENRPDLHIQVTAVDLKQVTIVTVAIITYFREHSEQDYLFQGAKWLGSLISFGTEEMIA